jgi:hypothetical protein
MKETWNAHNTTRTVRIAAAMGAVSAAFAVVGAPTAVAQPGTIDCQDGQIVIDGQCNVPNSMDSTTDALGLPNGTVNDVVPSLPQSGSGLDQGGGSVGGGGGGSVGGAAAVGALVVAAAVVVATAVKYRECC